MGRNTLTIVSWITLAQEQPQGDRGGKDESHRPGAQFDQTNRLSKQGLRILPVDLRCIADGDAINEQEVPGKESTGHQGGEPRCPRRQEGEEERESWGKRHS